MNDFVTQKMYLKASDVAEVLGISVSKAYQIIKECNADLKAKGFLTISGRVSAKYFAEKTYGGTLNASL